MLSFRGLGLFFNMLEDLERFAGIESQISWVAPLMAPDQDAVQHNRKEWAAWRSRLSTVAFVPWFWCDDPDQDYANIDYVLSNYKSEGILLNCELPYCLTGKWKAKHLCDLLKPKYAAVPTIMSYAGIPEQIDMDWRSFANAGMVFAPQAYFNEYAWATPQFMYDNTIRPWQIHVGRDYRIQPTGQSIRWGRVLNWDGGPFCTLRDIRANRLYKVAVDKQQDGDYVYMTIKTGRKMFDNATATKQTGVVLGFQDRGKVFPTVGTYEHAGSTPAPADIKSSLNAISNLKGASVYLGEVSTNDQIKASWEAIQ